MRITQFVEVAAYVHVSRRNYGICVMFSTINSIQKKCESDNVI